MELLTYNRIKEMLAKYNKTNLDLAEHVKRHEQTVSAWCRNNSQPDIATLYKVADFFNIEAGELLTAKKDLESVIELRDQKRKRAKSKKIRGSKEK